MGDNNAAAHNNGLNVEDRHDVFVGGLQVSTNELSDEHKISPRRIRNQSYYRAVGHSDNGSCKRHLAVRKKTSGAANRSRALLYQQLTERALHDEMEEDDDNNNIASLFHTQFTIPTEFDMRSILIDGNKSNTEDVEISEGILLWSNIPSVRSSGILLSMTSKEKKRQEAMYELYTSEQSYLRSLNVFVTVFYGSEELKNTVSSVDHHHLFSNLLEIKACSEGFLKDLAKRYEETPDSVLLDVCDIVHHHIGNGNFKPYVTYCANEVYQQRAFQRLSTDNSEFVSALKQVESNPSTMGLPLHSFLLLPMQRVTRLPLLVDMICQKCDSNTYVHSCAMAALRDTKRLVKDCNDRAKSLQQTEDMIALQRQLEFKTRSFALVSQSRHLLKRGPLIRLVDDTVLGFKKLTKQEYYAFLFNDVIILSKKKNDEKYAVADICYRHKLKVQGPDDENSFLLVMERNQDGVRVLHRFQAESPSSCARWVTSLKNAIKKEESITPNCVQVRIVRAFRSDETDLISLQPADVLFVMQATSDGWYYGERLVDGRRGWFPSAHAKEVLNQKTKDSNFRKGTRMYVIETEL